MSYSRKDCSEYASNLANAIIEKGYSCYLDQWGSDPGKSLPKKLKSKIKNSSIFIILGSDEAISSEAIDQEIDLFLSTKRVIIPVSFGNIFEAKWFPKVEGIAIFNEKEHYIIKGKPHIDLIERIVNSFTYTKQTKRIQNSTFSAIALIITSVIASLLIISELRVEIQDSNAKLNANTSQLVNIQENLNTTSDSLRNVSNALEKRKADLVIANQRFKEADSLTKIFEAQSKNYFSIANKANSNGLELFKEVQLICKNQFQQPVLLNNDGTLNYTEPFAVFYDFDRYNLRPEAQIELNKILFILRNYKNISIRIEAKMSRLWSTKNLRLEDEIGSSNKLSASGMNYYYSAAYAKVISQKRAKSVTEYFISQGIDQSKISDIDMAIPLKKSLSKIILETIPTSF